MDLNGINDDNDINENVIHFVLTNARSLPPKINSLIDMIHELDLTFAAVTETWFKGGLKLKQELSDIEQAADIKFICRNRPGRGAQRGGGVALAFRASVCNFKERKMKNMPFETLCAVGNAGKIKRKLVVFVTYLPPQINAKSLEQFNELLGCEIATAKVCYGDPIIVLAGDLNNKDVSGALDIDGDIALVHTQPTRGRSTLDLVYTNVPDRIVESEVRSPLESEDGRMSDHGCVRIKVVMPASKNFTYVRKTVRKRTERGDDAFGEDLAGVDWSVMEGLSPDEMVAVLESKVAELTDKHCPTRSIRIRSNEKPWITNGIRRRSRKKKRLYKREGRSMAWTMEIHNRSV